MNKKGKYGKEPSQIERDVAMVKSPFKTLTDAALELGSRLIFWGAGVDDSASNKINDARIRQTDDNELSVRVTGDQRAVHNIMQTAEAILNQHNQHNPENAPKHITFRIREGENQLGEPVGRLVITPTNMNLDAVANVVAQLPLQELGQQRLREALNAIDTTFKTQTATRPPHELTDEEIARRDALFADADARLSHSETILPETALEQESAIVYFRTEDSPSISIAGLTADNRERIIGAARSHGATVIQNNGSVMINAPDNDTLDGFIEQYLGNAVRIDAQSQFRTIEGQLNTGRGGAER